MYVCMSVCLSVCMYVCMYRYVCNKFKILALFSVIHDAMVMIEILPLTL